VATIVSGGSTVMSGPFKPVSACLPQRHRAP
jgi:hypothetical protein